MNRAALRTLRRAAAGITLIEVMLVLIVLGVIVSAAEPRFVEAVEQTRVDQAAGTLRTIWLGERLNWMEHHAFTSSLAALAEAHFVEPTLPAQSQPFLYEIISADDAQFTARATRTGSTDWNGELLIDEQGEVTGHTQDGGGLHVDATDA